MCQWLWLGSQQPSAEFNCSLPPGPDPVSTAQILCQQSLFVECGLGIRRYVAAGAPPNITTLGFMPSNSNMTNGVRPPCAMCDKLHFFQHLAKKLQSRALTNQYCSQHIPQHNGQVRRHFWTWLGNWPYLTRGENCSHREFNFLFQLYINDGEWRNNKVDGGWRKAWRKVKSQK